MHANRNALHLTTKKASWPKAKPSVLIDVWPNIWVCWLFFDLWKDSKNGLIWQFFAPCVYGGDDTNDSSLSHAAKINNKHFIDNNNALLVRILMRWCRCVLERIARTEPPDVSFAINIFASQHFWHQFDVDTQNSSYEHSYPCKQTRNLKYHLWQHLSP